MTWIRTIVANEPVIIRVIVAVISLGVAYGLDISDDQTSTITEVAGSMIALLSVLSARQAVTPTGKAEKAINEAYLMEPGAEKKPSLANPNPKI